MNLKLGIVLAVVLQACASQREIPLSEAQQIEIRLEVKQLLEDNFAEIKRQGFVGEVQYLDNSPQFFWIPPSMNFPISYDSTVAILKQATPRFTHVESKWDTLIIQPLRKDVATFAGKYRSAYTNKAGNVSHYKLTEFGVVIKRNNKWKLVNGRTSSIQ